MKINQLFIIFFSLYNLNAFCVVNNKNTDTLKHVSEAKYFSDDQVAARLDELATSILFSGKNFYADTAKLNIYNFKPDEVPQYTDAEYEKFINQLNIRSPFPFVYNEDVKRYINLYAFKRRMLTSRMLGLAEYYFPLFEEKLDMFNLPLELKYLAVIESALNPVAVSRAGASGLWQFMHGTGKIYGLEVTSFTDDRYDPLKATIAACEHFVDLYNIYNDWALVLAAYNAGSGTVNRAIRKSGGSKDYWKIRTFMPKETQNYVPTYIGVALVMTYAAEHNLYPIYPGNLYIKTDTLTIQRKITFEQISEALSMPIGEIISLNPIFKNKVIPSCDEKKYVLKLPYNKVGEFLANEEEIYNFKTLDQLIKEDYATRNNIKPIANTSTHIVKKGETLSMIARNYGCTVKDIQSWNNMKSTVINTGQKLVVSKTVPKTIPTPKPPVNTIKETHIVENNETLRNVSQKYNCSVDNIRLWNNITNLNLKQGQELVIHIPVTDTTTSTSEINFAEILEIDLDKNTNNTVNTDTAYSENINPNNIIDNNKQGNNIQYIYHVVQKGDTLWNISQRYEQVTIDDIKKLNNLKENDLIPGQKLKLPVKDKS